MEKSIFREKKIEELNSPDELNEYLKVTSPSIGLIMAAVIVLLAGMIVWACVGEISTKADASALVQGNEVIVYLTGERASLLDKGDLIEIEGETVKVTETKTDEYGRAVGKAVVNNVKEGSYEVKVIVESIRPISFLFR
ncbi:MAG: hypothetical protein IIZ28_04850 [Erysipelotrichaceae bacterium]|nr:hypothetical protein [Erysipelotrichaceae bacterium]